MILTDLVCRESPGVIACCNPVPPLVKQHLIDIHRLVLKAREFDPTAEVMLLYACRYSNNGTHVFFFSLT